MDDYLPRLKQYIKTGKLDQAITLLEQLPAKPVYEKQEVLQILALASDKTALKLLSFLTDKDRKDPEIHGRLIQLTCDRAHLNFKFALILFENADDQTIIQAAPLLRHILSNETKKKLLNITIRTAGKLKINALTSDIAEFIFYDDIDLKTEAVKALERIGTALACEKLEQASKTDKCDPNILDAIQALKIKNQDKKTSLSKQTKGIEYNQTAFDKLASKDVKKRFAAFMNFSKQGSQTSAILLKHLKTRNTDPKNDRDHDLMINILHLIARTLPVEAVTDLFALAGQKKMHSTIKFAAYNALASFPKLDSAAEVVQGLWEEALFVRLAAIKTLDKNLSDFVCAEIKNKIESGTKNGESLAREILDARAKHLIEFLMISDTFSYMASNYLNKTAPIPVLDTFINILEKRNLQSTAKKYMNLRKEKMSWEKKQCVVISSSDIILNTYSKLICTCGYSSLTFQNPQDAFEAFVFKKPCAIICDLFLNEMTGMDLAVEARQLYSRDDVPIIISTLQKSLDNHLLEKELNSAGVNKICDFPPTLSRIKAWIK